MVVLCVVIAKDDAQVASRYLCKVLVAAPRHWKRSQGDDKCLVTGIRLVVGCCEGREGDGLCELWSCRDTTTIERRAAFKVSEDET